jgi:hypothetical protein
MYKYLKFRPAAEWRPSGWSRRCGQQQESGERTKSAIPLILQGRSMERAQEGRKRLLRSHVKVTPLPRALEKRHWPSIRRQMSRRSRS